MKSYLENSLPLLHQRSKIQPPHHLTQGNLLKPVFPTPPIGKKKFPLSGIMGWRLMMTWNHPYIMFLWLILLLLTHCLRDIHCGGMVLISVLW